MPVEQLGIEDGATQRADFALLFELAAWSTRENNVPEGPARGYVRHVHPL